MSRLLSRSIPSTARTGPPISGVARSRAERDAKARAALAADMLAAGGRAKPEAAPGSWAMDVPLTNGTVTVAGSLPPSKPGKSVKGRRAGRW